MTTKPKKSNPPKPASKLDGITYGAQPGMVYYDKAPAPKPKTDRLNGMKGVQEWSKKRTTSEPIPSTVSKEAAAIIRKVQARNKRDAAKKG